MSVEDTNLSAYHKHKKRFPVPRMGVFETVKRAGVPLTNSEIAQRFGWAIRRVNTSRQRTARRSETFA